jgi:hypothetical protein
VDTDLNIANSRIRSLHLDLDAALYNYASN